jgi:hypothetical protein
MWPWEHAAVGYLLVSVVVRAVWSAPPGDRTVLVGLFATQFPDLLDKPLGWVFGVFPSGVSVAHSVFVASVLCAGVIAAGGILDRRQEALAFAVGYASHLLGDVLYPALTGGQLSWSILLWPVVVTDVQGETPALEFVGLLFDGYLQLVSGGESGVGYFVLFELSLLALALVVWLVDGRPGLPPFRGDPPRP